MCPDPWASMIGSAAWVQYRTPNTLTWIIRRHSSVGASRIGPSSITPALLISASRRPRRSRACSTKARAWSSSPTSAAIPKACPPSSVMRRASASMRSARRAVSATAAPARAHASAVASPMPDDAPVIATTCPERSSFMTARLRSPSAVCFALDSLPPVPVLAGAAVSHEDLVLEAADGTRFAAFEAVPDDNASNAGVVILPDVRGLYRFYEELALRFAERGYAAIAFDYFGRTAGVGKRDDDFEYMPHVQATTAEGIQADVAAAVEWLRMRAGVDRVFTVGFCMGGRQSWLSAAGGHGLAGAVGFYGRPGLGQDGKPGPVQRAGEMECPILALQAGDDRNITADDNAELERALEAAGVEHELATYEGAPHSFFDRKQEELAAASDDAWQRTLAFIDGHTG